MGKIIPFKNIDIRKISDGLFAEIENYLIKSLNEEMAKSDGNISIIQAKQNAINSISKKFNLTIETTNEIVREIQLKNLDNDINQ